MGSSVQWRSQDVALGGIEERIYQPQQFQKKIINIYNNLFNVRVSSYCVLHVFL